MTAVGHWFLLRLPWRMAEEWHAIVIAGGSSARIVRALPASSVCPVEPGWKFALIETPLVTNKI
jgi:hypothetical protein